MAATSTIPTKGRKPRSTAVKAPPKRASSAAGSPSTPASPSRTAEVDAKRLSIKGRPAKRSASTAARRMTADERSALRATCPRSRASSRRRGVAGSVRSSSLSSATGHLTAQESDQDAHRRGLLQRAAFETGHEEPDAEGDHDDADRQPQGEAQREDVHFAGRPRHERHRDRDQEETHQRGRPESDPHPEEIAHQR